MNRVAAEKQLAALGFEIDWNCTVKTYDGWSGTMDAVGRGQIEGDCRGEVVFGDTLAEFLQNAIKEAEHGLSA